MNVERNQKEITPGTEEANSRWRKIDSRERQVILAQLVQEGIIDSPGKIIKLKYSNLDEMPKSYAGAIAKKLGLVE